MKFSKQDIIAILLVLVLALVVLVTDQVLKVVFVKIGWPVVLNLGVAFGLLPSTWWFKIDSLIVIGLVLWLVKDRHLLRTKRQVAVGLLLGGGLTNLIDRWWIGSVRDFVLLDFMPAFNLADLAIVIGVGLLILEEFRDQLPAFYQRLKGKR